jgi:phage major head subunit gpT-like protein
MPVIDTGLSSRAIIGRFYMQLEQALGLNWWPRIAMQFSSDQASEEYKWLGMAPAMREWIGARMAKGLRDNGLTITNKTYESTLPIDVDEQRRDKTGQIQVRIDDLARRVAAHPVKLLHTATTASISSTPTTARATAGRKRTC